MKTLALVFVTLFAAILLAPPGVAASASTASGTTYVLSNDDNGAQLMVRAGDTVVVRLDGSRRGNVIFGWSQPESSAPDVLQKVSGGTWSSGGAYAYFTARAAGTAEVSAVQTCRTSGETACIAVAYEWRASVTVSQ